MTCTACVLELASVQSLLVRSAHGGRQHDAFRGGAWSSDEHAVLACLHLKDFSLVVWLRGAAWSLQHPSPLSPACACNPAAVSMKISGSALEQHCKC